MGVCGLRCWARLYAVSAQLGSDAFSCFIWTYAGPRGILQHRQPPPTDPPSPDSTDLKISAIFYVTFTLSRSSSSVLKRTLDHRASWALHRNSIKASAPSFKEPPLPSTPAFWERVTPSTTITRWSLLRSWVALGSLRVKKLASKLHVHSVNYAAELVHTRRDLSSSIINSHQETVSGQACKATQSPLIFSFFFWWRSFTVPGTKVAPFP